MVDTRAGDLAPNSPSGIVDIFEGALGHPAARAWGLTEVHGHLANVLGSKRAVLLFRRSERPSWPSSFLSLFVPTASPLWFSGHPRILLHCCHPTSRSVVWNQRQTIPPVDFHEPSFSNRGRFWCVFAPAGQTRPRKGVSQRLARPGSVSCPYRLIGIFTDPETPVKY